MSRHASVERRLQASVRLGKLNTTPGTLCTPNGFHIVSVEEAAAAFVGTVRARGTFRESPSEVHWRNKDYDAMPKHWVCRLHHACKAKRLPNVWNLHSPERRLVLPCCMF